MAELTKEEIIHIARLANITLSEEEIEKFGKQLVDILSFVDNLNSVETSDVEPLANITGKKNIFREDIVGESLSQEEALSNAKSTHNSFFKIKAVFER